MADTWSSVVSSAGTNFGAAVTDLFQAKGGKNTAAGFRLQSQGMRYQAEGDRQAASGFQSAADLARMNVDYSMESTAIQKAAALRASTLAIGGQQADVAAAGLSSGGSAQYLLMASQEQAALTQHMLDTQGRINVDAYMEQTQAYITQAHQQETSAKVADTAALSAEESAKAAEEAAKGNEYAGLIQGVVGAAKIGAMFL